MGYYNIQDEFVIQVLLRLGEPPKFRPTGLKAGQMISRNRDENDPRIWDVENSVSINIRLLNSLDFSRVTGLRPPSTPVTQKLCREHGIPWSVLYDDDAVTMGTKVGQGTFKDLKEIKSSARADELEGPELIIAIADC
ncbi:hypothetical protein FRB94_011059 [Tulasnella sp. JGI-2019a]|nr:hypothetical protein FRB94_011059 [Tulasnella sp. JGI-2019a]KAG9034001.1 hypothetical protein FRB95_013974 [Tulasnella sp. JGI-2019a]